MDNILVSVRAVFLDSVVPLPDLGYSGAMAAVCEAVCSLTYDLHQNSHVACDSPDPGSYNMLFDRRAGQLHSYSGALNGR